MALVCVLVCTALGVLAAAAMRAASRSGLESAPVAEVLLGADGRTLSASASGVCLPAAALFAHEERASVTVTLTTVPRTGACTSGIETRTYSTTLHAPLGTRTLIDSSDGLGVLVFDERNLLRPGALPVGYTRLYDAALYADGDGAYGPDWDAACTEVFADARGDLLWISQSYGRHWPAGWAPRLPLVAVRHSLARSRAGALAWQENGQSFLIISTPRSNTYLSTSQLVAVAQSLGAG